ncbi:uncharacterized protein KQ657_000012 [Scheffersomyces spartinae]|uniref:Uncharacterized protein n=1 Tax=Scheffersomyces spartinae TaxID=45513 RepID=A0A9P8AKK6_9ASCO|nr:uncharacterized protein KQ657_000012 [Scheffersomyces spartinae]KAG7196006.1 hypothetical protein KQ657_000012 [Scheffersomyces spartinae]
MVLLDRERKKLANRLSPLFEGIYELVDKRGNIVSEVFQRLPLRTGTDYYKVIQHPVSLHGISRKVKKMEYDGAQDFINDLAQITWNARLYNVRGSEIYQKAVVLNQYILEKVIPKLSSDKTIPGYLYLYYPDLGVLPEDDGLGGSLSELAEGDILSSNVTSVQGSPSITHGSPDIGRSLPTSLAASTQSTPQPVSQAKIINFDLQRKHPVYGKQTFTPNKLTHEATGARRGRPPIIDKPFETRIKGILKQMKKLRDPNDPNRPLTMHFERLPDPKSHGQYFQLIHNPISLNEIRTKVRSRKYNTVDECIADLDLMFQNAKLFYGNDQYSQVFRDCLMLEQEANLIIQTELKRSEKELLESTTGASDGILRTPLDSIEMKGFTYKIGDWVLLNNPNDPEKPTVGQIYRLWSIEDGTLYTNVCWYYRPEQTCHKFDRLFYVNEVCKTAQYRDHLATEILGPCFVIFLTRYQKGDLPEGFIPTGAPWFVCEFRYNETSHVFNRIRTWKACLPDEVRDQPEPPIIHLNEPRKLIKYDSPIRHLLPPDADMNMPIPEPTRDPNNSTPPIAGLVYLRPPVRDDELGQYVSSPNVTPTPENDDKIHNRKAYIFTPVSQLKFGSTTTQAPNTPTISMTQIPNAVAPLAAQAADRSYNIGVKKFKLFEFQQPQQQQLQQQQQQQPQRFQPPILLLHQPPSQQMFTQTPQVTLPHNSSQRQPMIPTPSIAQPTRTAAVSAYTPQHLNTATSRYSVLLPGGVLSYTIEDDGGLASLSGKINIIKRKAGEMESDEVVWYRAPPLSVHRKIITSGISSLGHSARYLSVKAKGDGM